MQPILDLPGGLGRLSDNNVEVRFTNADGATEVWIIKLLDGNRDPHNIIHAGVVWKAYTDDGMDSRIANQRNIIERLWAHIRWHHKDYGPGGLGCPVSNGEVKL